MLFSLRRHGNDLSDSQLQPGRVEEVALLPCWRVSKLSSRLRGGARTLSNQGDFKMMRNCCFVAVVFGFFCYVHVDILPVSRSFASDHWFLSPRLSISNRLYFLQPLRH